jgi:hypothetical protein
LTVLTLALSQQWGEVVARPEFISPMRLIKLNSHAAYQQPKAMMQQGMTLREVAKHFGVSHSVIWWVMHMKGSDA